MRMTVRHCCGRSVSADALRKLTSAGVGGGMLELYWLPAMDRIRELPELLAVTRQLLRATWVSNKVCRIEAAAHLPSHALALSPHSPAMKSI